MMLGRTTTFLDMLMDTPWWNGSPDPSYENKPEDIEGSEALTGDCVTDADYSDSDNSWLCMEPSPEEIRTDEVFVSAATKHAKTRNVRSNRRRNLKKAKRGGFTAGYPYKRISIGLMVDMPGALKKDANRDFRNQIKAYYDAKSELPEVEEPDVFECCDPDDLAEQTWLSPEPKPLSDYQKGLVAGYKEAIKDFTGCNKDWRLELSDEEFFRAVFGE